MIDEEKVFEREHLNGGKGLLDVGWVVVGTNSWAKSYETFVRP
jgi:hypothetical protein